MSAPDTGEEFGQLIRNLCKEVATIAKEQNYDDSKIFCGFKGMALLTRLSEGTNEYQRMKDLLREKSNGKIYSINPNPSLGSPESGK